MTFNISAYVLKRAGQILMKQEYDFWKIALCGIALSFIFTTYLQAEEKGTLYSTDPTSTVWVKSKNAKSRLLNGYIEADPKEIVAGLEILLRKNWKTYWRVPGEAGLPPRFDFSGSKNLAKADVKWPAPNRYVDQFGVAIGYKDRVIFPISISAKDPQKPVILNLKVDYAVCEIVCIPLSAEHELSFKLGEKLEGNHLSEITYFMDRVPRPISEYKKLTILNVRAISKDKKPLLELDLKSTIGFRQPEIFIEGPEALYFRTPKLTSRPSVVSRWHVPISGDIPENGLVGEKIKITFIDGDRQIEADYEIKK